MEKSNFKDRPVTVFQLLMLFIPNIITVLVWAIAITSDLKVTKSNVDLIRGDMKEITASIKEVSADIKKTNETLYLVKEQGAVNQTEIISLKEAIRKIK